MDLDVIFDTGINWSDIDVLSDAGMQLAGFRCLS